MAEGDNRAVYTGTAETNISRELGGATVAAPEGVDKDDPIAMPRLPEDQARSDFYAGVGVAETQKDELPEHQARRNAYPHITASSS